jgi:predicted permease
VVIVIVGVAPAIRASAVGPGDALTMHARGADYGGRAGFTDALVVVQIAVSVVLVAAAGLFVRSLTSLTTRDLGFVPDRVMLTRIDSRRAIAEPAQRLAVYERIRQEVSKTPGVEYAATSSMTPVSDLAFDPPIQVSGGRDLPPAERRVYTNTISADWFRAYGMRIVEGRPLTDADRIGTEPVAVVNQAFAARFLGGANPIDHFIMLPEVLVQPKPNVPVRIVGVVADAVYLSLRETPQATMYLPIAQRDEPFVVRNLGTINLSIAARTGSPDGLARSVAASIENVNPQVVVTFRLLEDQVNDSLARERVMAILASFFGGVALLLAAIGLYGVTSSVAVYRRLELGIRIALGASRASVVWLAISRVVWLVTLGLGGGVLVSLWASQFVATLLYGLQPHDPATFTSAILVLVMIATVAAGLPAWRATRLDPAAVLRAE